MRACFAEENPIKRDGIVGREELRATGYARRGGAKG
jgi:hypothetical protein